MNVTECRPSRPELQGDVFVDVVVGEGHRGGIVVYLDGERVATGADRIADRRLGSSEELAGRELRVVCTVRPVPPSRRASLACTLRSEAGSDRRICSVDDHQGSRHTFRILYEG